MKKDLSFGRDYANLVSPDQNVKENIWKHGKRFVFDGTADGDAGYGTFNFKVDAPEYLPKNGIVPVELRLWRFEIERRVIVCAVAQHFMATYTPSKDLAWHFYYSIEAIDACCFHHKADGGLTQADREMFARIIAKMVPAYHRHDFENFYPRASAPLSIIERWTNPDPQIVSFLNFTTTVAADVATAELQMKGIDDFFEENWRNTYSHSAENRAGVRFRGRREHEVYSPGEVTSVEFDGLEFSYNYQECYERIDGKRFISAVIYAPTSPNSPETPMHPAKLASIGPETIVKANQFARFQVYKYLRASNLNDRSGETPISVILLTDAL